MLDVEADGDSQESSLRDRLAPTARRADVDAHAHPLRLDTSTRSPSVSPPPWEVVEPPLTNGRGHRADTDADWATKAEASFAQKQTSRRLIPVSSYYFGPPPSDSAFGTDPIGQIGVHHPREIVRVERDYSGGDVVQFAPTYPLELEGRITPTQFLETVNAINELLIAAHSLRHSFVDNFLDIFTLHFSKLVMSSHYDRVRFLVPVSRCWAGLTWVHAAANDAPASSYRGPQYGALQSGGAEHPLATQGRVFVRECTRPSHFRALLNQTPVPPFPCDRVPYSLRSSIIDLVLVVALDLELWSLGLDGLVSPASCILHRHLFYSYHYFASSTTFLLAHALTCFIVG
ncbi:hypothetical protein EVG20_g4588 [Dentipellis fragilis]|uniref:Ras modification protein ERF4 n=1 Tax=Dentipellis fragilis TaxID=205917 RepID=A0A4Y9YY59_9AGAM|nr:hypothetical protein EVG20_g4588 [Dentipellis fragilis]